MMHNVGLRCADEDGSLAVLSPELTGVFCDVDFDDGPEAIWLLADRRLSAGGRQRADNARKVIFLQTMDGTAILGYAGLGMTAMGTEPADWMSAVLRGRNLPLEHSLRVLAEAMKQQ